MLCNMLLWISQENFMSSKFFKVICAAILSIGLLGQANATTISYFEEGELYTDADSKFWEYIGFFDLDFNGLDARDSSGYFLNPELYNGLEAALSIFGVGGDSLQDFALSAFGVDGGYPGEITASEIAFLKKNNPNHADVNHMAWYDTFGEGLGLNIKVETEATNLGGDPSGGGTNAYDAQGDISAFVDDRAVFNFNLNYVFKAIEVPEPSNFAVFAFAILCLVARRLRR